MSELEAACEQHGISFGFYYSQAFDWGDPERAGQRLGLQESRRRQAALGGRDWYDDTRAAAPAPRDTSTERPSRKCTSCIAKYHPDILWFDTPRKLPLSEQPARS